MLQSAKILLSLNEKQKPGYNICIEHLWSSFTCIKSLQLSKVDMDVIILILQGKKLKFRVLKQLSPNQRASKWLSWSSNLGLLTLHPESSTHQTQSSFRNKLMCLLLQELFPEKGINTPPLCLLFYSIYETLNVMYLFIPASLHPGAPWRQRPHPTHLCVSSEPT